MRTALYSMYKGDGFVPQLLSMALPQYEEDLAELKATARPASGLAHKLKGSYRTIYYTQAGEAAFRIEKLLKSVPAEADPWTFEAEGYGLLAVELARLQRYQALLKAAVDDGFFVCESN